jgi:capsular exopolysaccharide synthesis family protein
LRSADEISALLRVAVLGAGPAMSRRQKPQERGQKGLLQPDSHEAEAFRTIRTAVLFGAPKEKARTMLVTSPAAGDGKSTLVSNLAIAMACAGQKTLILDADFRKPTQHLIFELDHEQRCLSEVLAGRLQLAAAIQSTGTKGLHVLPCGHAILNPAEVLNGQRFGRLLECLTSAYDRVLIDAPPVTIVTDAQILGALSDITVLVVKANKSTRRVTQRALDALQTVGAHLIGVVINDVQRSGDHYGYYFGQYQQYGGSGSGNGRANKTGRGVTTSLPSRGLPLQATSEETKS